MRDFCALQLIHSLRRLRLDDEAIASARSPRGIEQVSIQRRIHTRPQNARGGSRTRGLWLRRPTLYPTELPAQNNNLKKKPVNRRQKRETGLEPATSTLARLHSTTELLPHAYGISRSFFMEATSRFELENGGFADLCLTTWLCRLICWSGRRDLNPRLQPWQGCTLPLSYSRSTKEGSTLETPFLSSSFFHFAGK